MRTRTKSPLVLAMAGTLAFTVPAASAPISAGGAALKAAAPSDVIDVRYRHGWGGGAVIGGLALGLIGGALIAGASRPYYGYGYGYGYPSYGYGYAPAYYGYGYPSYGYAYAPAYYGPPRAYWGPRRVYVRRAYWGPRRYWGPRPFYW
jgi:hypothetical protein